MRCCFIFAIISAVSRSDECSRIREDSFCNDSDHCEGIFDTFEPSWPLTCFEAYSAHHSVEFLSPDNSEPEYQVASEDALLWARDDDADFGHLIWCKYPGEEAEEEDGGCNGAAVDAYFEYSYPADIYETLSRIEEMGETIGGRILSSFPRVLFDLDTDGPVLGEFVTLVDTAAGPLKIHADRLNILSHFRNNESIQKYQWAVSMSLHRLLSFKPSDSAHAGPYMAGIAPYVHAFMYMQYHLEVDYPNMYALSRNAISSLVEVDPKYCDPCRWYVRVTKPESDNWPVPEITHPNIDWDVVLFDSGSMPEIPDEMEDEDDKVRQRMGRLERLLYQANELLDLRDQTDDGKYLEHYLENHLVTPIVYLLIYAWDQGLDIQRLCGKFFVALECSVQHTRDVNAGLGIQAREAWVDRCNETETPNLMTRVEIVETIEMLNKVYGRRQIWISENKDGSYLEEPFTKMRALTQLDLAGHVFISLYGDDVESSKVPGGITSWLINTITSVFGSDRWFEQHADAQECEYYTLRAGIGSSEDERSELRQIGRILALYLREGNKDNNLSRYLTSCESMGHDLNRDMFFNSMSIRRGFYDVFTEESFERVLLDSEDMAQMFTYVADESTSDTIGVGLGVFDTL
jgi:hypothetical protein